MENKIYKKTSPYYWVIWFWYNDWFRILSLFLFIPISVLMTGIFGELGRNLSIAGMSFYIGALFIFNDYENLEKIGLDVWRTPLKK